MDVLCRRSRCSLVFGSGVDICTGGLGEPRLHYGTEDDGGACGYGCGFPLHALNGSLASTLMMELELVEDSVTQGRMARMTRSLQPLLFTARPYFDEKARPEHHMSLAYF